MALRTDPAEVKVLRQAEEGAGNPQKAIGDTVHRFWLQELEQ